MENVPWERLALLASICAFGALSLAVVVAAVVLALSLAARHGVQTQQTIDTIVRHQDEATYEQKAVADALRAGAQRASLEVGQPAPKTRPHRQVQEMLDKTTEDVGFVNKE